MYDVIGDIHGHADELIQLLHALGYRKQQGIYCHPERKVIFLGDFIDRGPQIREVLETVRPMIETGTALAVMGNHELNALAYHTEDSESPGQYLRRHNAVNERQHHKTLEQLTPDELDSYLNWFRTLPLWLELEGLRAVHACWDETSLRIVSQGLEEQGGVTAAWLHSACRPGKTLFAPVEILLKGKEAKLPSGISFQDKDGHVRTHTRLRWYLPPDGHTYQSYALTESITCDLPLDDQIISRADPYPATERPVFVGHYWLDADRPQVLAENIACLDYSVAKGGFLCAYRWDGEQKLNNDHFLWIAKS